jgi:hypothetical protein
VKVEKIKTGLHNIVNDIFNRKREKGEDVDHIDGDPNNKKASNLVAKPLKENRFKRINPGDRGESSRSHLENIKTFAIPLKKRKLEQDDQYWTAISDGDSSFRLSIFGNVKNDCGEYVTQKRSNYNTYASVSLGTTVEPGV